MTAVGITREFIRRLGQFQCMGLGFLLMFMLQTSLACGEAYKNVKCRLITLKCSERHQWPWPALRKRLATVC